MSSNELCPFCPSTFSRQSVLHVHLQMVHEKEWLVYKQDLDSNSNSGNSSNNINSNFSSSSNFNGCTSFGNTSFGSLNTTTTSKLPKMFPAVKKEPTSPVTITAKMPALKEEKSSVNESNGRILRKHLSDCNEEKVAKKKKMLSHPNENQKNGAKGLNKTSVTITKAVPSLSSSKTTSNDKGIRTQMSSCASTPSASSTSSPSKTPATSIADSPDTSSSRSTSRITAESDPYASLRFTSPNPYVRKPLDESRLAEQCRVDGCNRRFYGYFSRMRHVALAHRPDRTMASIPAIAHLVPKEMREKFAEEQRLAEMANNEEQQEEEQEVSSESNEPQEGLENCAPNSNELLEVGAM